MQQPIKFTRTPCWDVYLYTNNSVLPPSLPVVHHLSLHGNSAHTEASRPIRKHTAPHAHRPLTPNQLGILEPGSEPECTHARARAETHTPSPKVSKADGQTDPGAKWISDVRKTDSIHIPATLSLADTIRTFPKATAFFLPVTHDRHDLCLVKRRSRLGN